MTFEFSEWREDGAWQRRLAADQATLEERLSADQREVLGEIAVILGVGDAGDVLALDFMVVFGSYARGDHAAGSDVDIYFEANLPEPTNRVDADRHCQVFGLPRGALATALRDGQEFGQSVIAHALVHDKGSFRRLKIFVDEGRTDRL